MADRDWDRERYRDDDEHASREFRDRQWGPRDDYRRRPDFGLAERVQNWWDRNVSHREDDRESHRWSPVRDREHHDREFENRGVIRNDWNDDRVGSDRGYRNTDYSASWGQQTTGGMRDSYSGGLVGGGYAGRGPKNWRRSEERIREDVNEALTRHRDVDASEVDVQVTGGEVTLTGTVSSRYEKRAAEDCAWNVTGVRDVHNHLKISQGVMDRISSAITGEEKR